MVFRFSLDLLLWHFVFSQLRSDLKPCIRANTTNYEVEEGYPVSPLKNGLTRRVPFTQQYVSDRISVISEIGPMAMRL